MNTLLKNCQTGSNGLIESNPELSLGSDHTDPNRLALAFWILQPFFFCAFLRLEGLRNGREFRADVFEKEPLLSDFGHEGFITRAEEKKPPRKCLCSCERVAQETANPTALFVTG